jgi:hypothetical protein
VTARVSLAATTPDGHGREYVHPERTTCVRESARSRFLREVGNLLALNSAAGLRQAPVGAL